MNLSLSVSMMAQGDDLFPGITAACQGEQQLKLVKLVRNFGEPAASFAGMSFASGDAVAVIAADLQDPPEDMNRLIAEWEQGHKVVLAVRKDRHGDPFFTQVFAFIFNILFKLVYKDFSPQGVGFS